MADTENTRLIPLTQGKFAIVDAADYDWLSSFKWHAHKVKRTFYAARGIRLDGKQRQDRMHRVIMGAGDDHIIDHINRDGLDNRRANLRLCTLSENARNTHSRKGASSAYIGVSWHKRSGKWLARLKVAGRDKYLGVFYCEADAAHAYDAAARNHFGEFANPNFPLTANHSAPQEQQP